MYFMPDVLTVVAIKSSDFWGLKSCSPGEVNICSVGWSVNQAGERDEVDSKFSSTVKHS
jgi:hypothetical protein